MGRRRHDQRQGDVPVHGAPELVREGAVQAGVAGGRKGRGRIAVDGADHHYLRLTRYTIRLEIQML